MRLHIFDFYSILRKFASREPLPDGWSGIVRDRFALNASAKSIRSREERVFSQGARMDRMNMRVVREMIFFDQTFFLVGLSSGTKLMGKL